VTENKSTHTNYDSSPLPLAVERRDLPLLDWLLTTGADVNAKDSNGNSSLMLASQKGYEDIVKRLLRQNDVIVDCEDSKRKATPLMDAASEGHIKVVQLLLEAGAEVNARTIHGNSPLSLAA
jgi:ankyrin repeat protein